MGITNVEPTHNTNMMTLKMRPHGTAHAPFEGLLHGLSGRDMAQILGSDELHTTSPRVNITEGKDHFQLELLAPGFAKEDILLNVQEGTLTISAEKKGQTSFKRSFRLPESVASANITAKLEHGVLTVLIPRTEPEKPVVHTIAIH
jgi:HSP20 family protein